MELTTLKKAISTEEMSYLEQLLSNPIKNLQDHSDTVLTEDEIAEALIAAKVKKEIAADHEKRLTESRERFKLMMEPFNVDQLISFCFDFYVQRFNRDFIIDKSNEALVGMLALYFTNDKRFEQGKFSLNKGLLLMGNVGTGKTELMRFFQKNKKQCFEILSCPNVADQFPIYREEFDKVYSTPKENANSDPTFFFQRSLGKCFDDLGTEEIKNDFGNKKNTLADIIMATYQRKDFTKIHITTNLDEQEIEARYGTRVRSRLREMFNVFVVEGKDRR